MEKMSLMFNGQMLHAQKIRFKHPISNEIMEFEAKLPQYFENVLKILDKRE